MNLRYANNFYVHSIPFVLCLILVYSLFTTAQEEHELMRKLTLLIIYRNVNM